jgi:hypothetical protein
MLDGLMEVGGAGFGSEYFVRVVLSSLTLSLYVIARLLQQTVFLE